MGREIMARQVQKHDIETNWKKAVNFVPYKGEIIIYDADYDEIENPNGSKHPRVKIGDGVLNVQTGKIEGTNVNDLPFINELDINQFFNIQKTVVHLDAGTVI